ncbi:spore protease YyaC [Paenibacillus agricola]|uniref:Spore protease YyaC n=1 Tax=Paenibacillus agricola TaxID=2716264 RepID=A0ABX0J404_9BACL|nr:spore protease YyaC [Paenibacillus agricola]NHN29839.1 spore protease YyaC [Paenibacillus agricola]
MKTAPLCDVFRVPYTHPTASHQLTRRLIAIFEELHPSRRVVIVCIGTDRSTGDSLGPLVGFALHKYRSSLFDLFGTLAEPVQALNLDRTLEQLHRNICDPFIIGIDSCLGQSSNVGIIHLAEGPIYPGRGVNKVLSPVGDIHIAGIVNVGGLMEHLVLQSTRLHVVMLMADLIARSIFRALLVSSKSQQKS